MKNNTELNLCHFYSLQKEYRKHGWAVPYSEFCQILTHTHTILTLLVHLSWGPARLQPWPGAPGKSVVVVVVFSWSQGNIRGGASWTERRETLLTLPPPRWCILWAKSSGFTRLRWLCQVNKNTLTSQLHNTVMVHNMNKNSHQSPKLTVGRTAQGSVITLCHHKPEVSPRASPGHRGNAAAEEMSCWFLRNESVTCIGGFAAWTLCSEWHIHCAPLLASQMGTLRPSECQLTLWSYSARRWHRCLWDQESCILEWRLFYCTRSPLRKEGLDFVHFTSSASQFCPPEAQNRVQSQGEGNLVEQPQCPLNSSSCFRTPSLPQQPWMDSSRVRALISGSLKLQVRWSFGVRLQGTASGEPQGAGCHSLTGLRVLTLLYHLNSCFADAQIHAFNSVQSNTWSRNTLVWVIMEVGQLVHTDLLTQTHDGVCSDNYRSLNEETYPCEEK